MEDAYQAALKEEEKITRKQSQKNRGRIHARGKGKPNNRGRFQSSIEDGGSSSSQSPRGGECKGRRSSSRGRSRGKYYQVKCYKCGKLGHMSW